MLKQIRTFLKDEDGAAAIEYALIAGLIAIVIVAGATALGLSIDTIFGKIATTLNNVSV